MKTVVYHTRHSTSNLHVHLVFVSKYRRKIFTAQILTELKVIFETVCCQLEASLIAFDGEEDHVHLLVLYPPLLAIAELVFRLKGVSSRIIRSRQYPSQGLFVQGNTLLLPKHYGARLCGVHLILLLPVEVHLFPLSDNT